MYKFFDENNLLDNLTGYLTKLLDSYNNLVKTISDFTTLSNEFDIKNRIVNKALEVVEADCAFYWEINNKEKNILKPVAHCGNIKVVENLRIGDGLTGKSYLNKTTLVDNEGRLISKEILDRCNSDLKAISVPINCGASIEGILTLVRINKPKDFNSSEKIDLNCFGNLCAVFTNHYKYLREIEEKKRIQKELEIASEICYKLLPDNIPFLKGFKVNYYFLPSREISGDYIDFIELSDEMLGVLIFDSMGKGLPASLLSTSIRSIVRAYPKKLFIKPSNLTFILNNFLIDEFQRLEVFASLFYGVLNKNGNFIYCSSAMPPAILKRSQNKIILLKPKNSLLGIKRDTFFEEDSIEIKNGDFLIICSDGLIDAENKDGETFGLKRLKEFILNNDLVDNSKFISDLILNLKSFVQNDFFSDDLTLVVLKKEEVIGDM